ncbi:NADPH oxidoreductase A-like [Haliotis rufescens]|uniref:NADPH oxidoreductase A-like n=1 Tax=Haliotis rufescens TaxID=6454 RepID=UPI00201EF5BD|nr:NADPH oxidoreductase A-like [Haliotis rufescens]
MWYTVVGVVGIFYYIWRTVRSSPDNLNKDTSIDAFIDTDVSEPDARSEKSPRVNQYYRRYDCIGRQILVLYGTEYGFSEELAKTLFNKLCDLEPSSQNEYPWQPRLVNVRNFSHVDLNTEQLCLIIISTSGDGVPPSEARPFYDSLLAMTKPLAHLNFSVLALGDSNYPHYCHTGRTVSARLLELGAVPIVKCQDVDQEEWPVIDQWTSDVLSAVTNVSVSPTFDYLDIRPSDINTGFSRHKPFMAKLVVANSCCLHNLSLPVRPCVAGDAVGIYPQNDPAHVAAILSTLGVPPEMEVDTPPWAYEPAPEKVSVEEALLRYYDIKHVPPKLLQKIHNKDSRHTDSLQKLLDKGLAKANTALHAYLDEREVRDIVSEFESVGLTLCDVLTCLRPLQPRYYSISSSPRVDRNTVCVTAAVVRYETLGVSRSGVTTCDLQDRVTVGDMCPVFISPNDDFRLPKDVVAPIILIGPGTGLAPFRAFMQEREHEPAHGKIFLYFGCRCRDKDFLYRDELERLSAAGTIRLRTAFSREGRSKVYVQHLLQEDAQVIWTLISQEGAYIYICGDARNMAHDVHATLINVIQGQGCVSEVKAIQYLADLERCERYQKDVWVT